MISHMVTSTEMTQLEALGFDEVEPGIVEDTPLNRKKIRMLGHDEVRWQYEQVLSEDRGFTGLIRVLDPATLLTRRESRWETMKGIMVKPSDMWSDYVHPDDYPLDQPGLPYWIHQRLTSWRRRADEGVPEEDRKPFPTRCETTRHDGTRCWAWVYDPSQARFCKAHLPYNADLDLRKSQIAKIKLAESAPKAADMLIYLAENATSEQVMLKANTEILDRVGVRAGTDVNVTGEVEVNVKPAELVRDKLSDLADRLSVTQLSSDTGEPESAPVRAKEIVPAAEQYDVVDAELVEEDE